MIPDDENNDDARRKPIKPYLKKGQGTARFRMGNYGRRSADAADTFKQHGMESPAISLPRFTPSSCIPNSARTVDSGISNEDETRPPTTASLPMDNPSTSPNRFEFQNKTPTVIEEHADKEKHVENEEEEHVSAIPTFVPDEASSSNDEARTEVSEEMFNCRAEASRLKNQDRQIHSMKSVSITPSSYTSNLSDPLYFSTPKSNEIEDNTFQAPSLVPPRFHPTVSSVASSLETPQTRPLASNRLNQMVQSEAQTGISLLNIPHRQRAVQFRQKNPINPSNQVQKENVDERQGLSASEHVYDLPLQVRGISHQRKTPESEIEKRKHNMMIQLRDGLAHLDYATEEVWSTMKKLKKREGIVRKREEAIERREKEVETHEEKLKDFEREKEEFQEDKKSEEDRLKRERRELERDRKVLQKGEGERQKEDSLLISNLREKAAAAETLNSKLRQDIRTCNDKIKKKDEEIEKLTKDYARSKNTCQTLEKRIKKLRSEKEQEEKEKEMFATVAGNRKSSYPLLHQSVGAANTTTSSTSSRYPSVSSLASNRKTSSKGRTVSFADDANEQSLEVIEELETIRRLETVSTEFGPRTAYVDSAGKVTNVTELPSEGALFEYFNGDFKYANRQNSVNIYRSAVDKTVVIRLVQYNISFIYSLQRQLEVIRPGNNITLISIKRREFRTELHGLNNGTYYTEIFNRSGRFITKDYCHPDSTRIITNGAAYSHRDNNTRYVQCSNDPEDFELIEPEFRLRWFKNEMIIFKIFGRPECNEKTLRIDLKQNTGGGRIEMVESKSVNGNYQKSLVYEWS